MNVTNRDDRNHSPVLHRDMQALAAQTQLQLLHETTYNLFPKAVCERRLPTDPRCVGRCKNPQRDSEKSESLSVNHLLSSCMSTKFSSDFYVKLDTDLHLQIVLIRLY